MLPGGPFPTDRDALENYCEVEPVRASGPGGQHRNKKETGIRLTHRPTGLVVMATERRSRTDNLEVAYFRMAERLDALQKVRRPRRPTRPSRSSVQRRLETKKKNSEKKAGRSFSDGQA